jgi:ankyrin repeat protein
MNGWSPLHVAAVRGAVSCVKLLLDAGADTSIVDLYGDSPADIAAAARGKKRLQLLELLHAPTRRQ